jgi:hypothetical protein
MKGLRMIKAYSWNGDFHCPACTQVAFSNPVALAKDDPDRVRDDNGIALDQVDDDGNKVRPLEDGTFWVVPCGTCRQPVQ